ncbi:DUF4157 domain-containing protein [Tenacibaculum sp. 190524A05c]|uniref:eCIS core domain-containing protein n=1 Tax=Tenacibaculum platacis TaxID=3137852 RepID=UPI0031FAC94E
MFAPKSQSSKPSSTNHSSANSFIQPKLNVGKPGDKYEVEADRAADQIVAGSKETQTSFFAPTVQKKSEDEVQKKEVNESEIQQKPLVDPISPGVQLKPEPVLQKSEDEDVQKVPEEEVQTKRDSNESSFVSDVVQQQSEEDIQEKEEEEIQEKEEEEIQQLQMSGGDDNSSLEQNLNSSKGGGNALPKDTQSEMESGFGADFSGVRVHNDSNAVQMNQELGSQAFTNGNDIYFNEGKYNPESDSGKHLLAHELTHTVQQGASPGVQTKLIQRSNNTNTNTGSSGDTSQETITPSHEYTDPTKGTVNTQSKTVTIPNIPVPTFKAGFGPSTRFTIPKGGFPRKNTHIPKWEEAAMSGSGFTDKFTEYAAASNAPSLMFNGNPIYYLTLKNDRRARNEDGSGGAIFGSIPDIKRRTSRPYWTSDGSFKPHDVDHKQELQLSGAEEDTNNMWMLESSANRSSGSKIKNSKKKQVNDLLTASASHLINPPSSYDDVKTNYSIVVENGVVGDSSMQVAGESGQTWDLSAIKDGTHLSGLKFLTESEVQDAGLRGSPNELLLFTGLTGGRPIKIPWDEAAQTSGRKDGLTNVFIGKRGGSLVEINSVIYNSASGEGNFGGSGTIICSYPKEEGLIEKRTNLAFNIRPLPGVSYGGYIENTSVLQAAIHALSFKYMSPITMTDVGLSDDIGLMGQGKISPSVPLIGDADIDLVLDEQGARLRKLFHAGEFNFPNPFEVTNSTLEVWAGTEGFGINGEMNFKINNVGDGFLRGNFSTERGFALTGGFNFDSELFDPAQIEVSYENEVLTVSGTIGIPEGKIKGVKNATITASYSENTFTATGDVELDIPGIQNGTMTVQYNDEGFSIGGEFQLRDDIPGIRGGSVSATISKQNGQEGYGVMVSGTAQPDIPGIDTQLSVTYDNGALTIEGSAAYSRGMLSGTVQIGATNRAIGDDGQPSGDPDENMRVYGGGSLTLTLTPWLQATAGVNFLPNGEIEITGRIGLPDTVDIFDRKSIDRNLFNMPAIEIPIFAIPLGPRSIGVVARITGGLDFSAGFGPGQIRNLYADVTYNPDREEETTISGHGEFVIPADAGLTLRGDLGLGVSVGIASLTGGIEVAGSLGLEGEALAQVDVNWSPQSGLAIDALGRVTVNPKFTFDVNAFARASLDLWLLSISETWRYNLASFSWGPDIQFGVEFPVNYREGEPFDMSFDDINVIYPELDIGDMLTDLGKDIKGDIF